MTTAEEVEASIVSRIESLRKARGSTEAHLMRATGVSRQTYKRSMYGLRSFTTRELISISDALGVKLSDLFNIEPEKETA